MAGSESTSGPGHSRADVDGPADVGGARQRWLLIAVFTAVIGVDQAVKWLAWRRFDESLINGGGYILLGRVIRSWFAAPASGAVADVLGGVLVVLGIGRLLQGRRPLCVLIGGGLVLAGSLSNLLDRLGMHNLTAPGSARGVVDFLPSGGSSRCNVADVLIVLGILLLGYASVRRRSAADGPRGRTGPGSEVRSGEAHRRRPRILALIILLAVITLAVTSAMNHEGVYAPTSPV
jgi:lipoprotein signal peptidase